jgi:hypothetical protein
MERQQQQCGCTLSMAAPNCPSGQALRQETSRLYHIMIADLLAYPLGEEPTEQEARATEAWKAAARQYERHV